MVVRRLRGVRVSFLPDIVSARDRFFVVEQDTDARRPSRQIPSTTVGSTRSPKGYRTQFATCIERKVDGYPAWRFGNGKEQGGEMDLADIAERSGYLKKRGAFDPSLEGGVPLLGGGAACQ